jgi:hypothetical protein
MNNAFPNGTLIRNPAGTVCVLVGGQKRYICSPVFQAMGAPVKLVYEISQADFDAIPTGLPYLPNWSLVINPAGCVAYVDGDTLHWVPADVYAYWQPLYGKPPIQVPDDVFKAHPGGAPFNFHKANGTLIRNPAGTVCVLVGGQKRYICSPVFQAMGAPVKLVFVLTQAEFDAFPTGLPYLPNWSLVVNPAGTVAYVDGDTLHWVSAETFGWWQPLYGKPSIQVPDEVFKPHPGGEEFNPPRPPTPAVAEGCVLVTITSFSSGNVIHKEQVRGPVSELNQKVGEVLRSWAAYPYGLNGGSLGDC